MMYTFFIKVELVKVSNEEMIKIWYCRINALMIEWLMHLWRHRANASLKPNKVSLAYLCQNWFD